MKYQKLLTKKYFLSFWQYIYLFSFLNLVISNIPLFKYSLNNIEFTNHVSIFTFATVLAAQFFLTVLIFILIGLIYTKLAKWLACLSFITNALAFYFINTFSVLLTKEMMSNVFNTDFNEAGELFSFSILFYLIVFGIIPFILFQRFEIKPTKFITKIFTLIISFALTLGWALANSSSWLWIDKHTKYIAASSLPWSYIINGIAYQTNKIQKPPQTLLPDLNFNLKEEEQLVILVIGESARSDRFGIYGYNKNTTPLLAKEDLAVMPNSISCTTYTTASIACILSHLGHSTKLFSNNEPLTSYLNRHGVSVIWRSKNWGEPDMQVNLYRNHSQLKALCKSNCENKDYDESLLYGLEEEIQQIKTSKGLIVLHQSGSHGPSYNTKYPASFEVFKPVCTSVQLEKCTQDELNNAYDNTIVYTDYFLSSLINLLKKVNKPVVMLYISDHGESLGENGYYLHGAPNMLAPKYQRDIPFIVWTNQLFKAERQLTTKQLIKQNNYSQDYIFHSILGAFKASSAIYNKEFDIFNLK